MGFSSGSSLLKMMTSEEETLFRMFQSAIGKSINRDEVHNLFFPLLDDGYISLSLIKKWAIVTGDMKAKCLDPNYAKNSSDAKITAPPFFLLTINDSTGPSALLTKEVLNPSPYPSINREKFPNFRGVMQVSSEWEFRSSVCAGDNISSKAVPRKIFWKHGKKMRLLFTVGDTEYRNQRNIIVATCSVTAVYMFKFPKER